MKLSIEYLNQRHAYWMYRIGETGLWNPAFFKTVTIQIRPACKSYNALFSRKWLKIKGKRTLTDRIFIYNKVEDFDPVFLDSILVHEMIHQYIIQNKIKDTSPHGRVFREFMYKINTLFPKELKIRISDRNPSEATSPVVVKQHTLLILHLTTGISYCAIVNPSKTTYFEYLVRRNFRNWKIKEYFWATSESPVFNNYSRCTRSLHGIKKSTEELKRFCNLHNVREIRGQG